MTTTTPAARAALHRLIDLALDAKAAGHDVFVSYSPHVRSAVGVSVYRDGWTEEQNASPTYRNYYVDFTETSILTIIADVERVLA